MSTQTHQADQPPSYDASASAPSYEDSTAAPQQQQHDPTLMQEPMTLVLDGQSIRGGPSADAAALYETDRGVASLGHATSTVELTRFERTVQSTTPQTADDTKAALDEKDAAAGQGSIAAAAPRIKLRRRHIFNLVHPTGTALAGEAAVGYYAKPQTRTTHAGTYGLWKKSHTLRADECKVLPVREKAKDGEARFEDKARPLFQVAKAKSGGAYEWLDAEGAVLAVDEEDDDDDDAGDGRPRLRIVARLESGIVDALVAMWCCWLWAEAAEAQPDVQGGGMEKGAFFFYPSSFLHRKKKGREFFSSNFVLTTCDAVRRRLRMSKEFPSSTRGNLISAAGF